VAPRLREMAAGTPLQARLEREPRNLHDSNAIKVVVVDERFSGHGGFHIGYLPRSVAQLYAPRLDTDTFPWRLEGRITELDENVGTGVLLLKRKPIHKT
jgi:hypothetical protein